MPLFASLHTEHTGEVIGRYADVVRLVWARERRSSRVHEKGRITSVSLDSACSDSGNDEIERSIKSVGADVEKGDNLSVAMSKKPIFPPMLLRMVAAGESTGKIDNMLEKMADFWDEEIEAMLDALTSLIEPMLIVFLGVIVGGIVIAMFLPIFKLNEVVSQNQSAH